eukprot:TRINITY_DN47_c0_g2_i3.p1 TRINITY_DN47_c0_g2~~TRINITY_DN47_c0_g2_i3.p1  ORF type:complete len:202 (+),score=99.45 TRINITY_DN47_c0_g2_i3:63-668(+)
MARPPIPLSKIIFNKFDTDESSTIDEKEFRNLCYSFGHVLSEEELRFAILSLSQSGHIQYDSFLKWWSNQDRFAKLKLDDVSLKFRNDAYELFRKHDTNGSGSIDKNEFTTFHTEFVARGFTNKTADNLLEDMDLDRQGDITFNELIDWLERNKHQKFQLPQPEPQTQPEPEPQTQTETQTQTQQTEQAQPEPQPEQTQTQ